MKKLLSTLFILMLALLTLTACGCDHLDKNDDGKCDECGDKFTDGTDAPVTPPSCQHRDADDNEKCDSCGEDFSDGTESTTNHTHTWTLSKTTDASCNANGEKIFTCPCGESKSESILMLGHSMENGMCAVCKRTESTGLKFTLSYDKKYYIVAGVGSCTDTDLIIPSTYNNLPVKEIGKNAFEECEQIISVTISEGIEKIVTYAFLDCSNLTLIKFPQTLTHIGDLGFHGCNSLISVTIPAATTNLGSSIFGGCEKLESINIDENNQHYSSVNGILYTINYDYTWVDGAIQKTPTGYITLKQYPHGRKDETFELLNNTIKVDEYAFSGAKKLKHIKLNDNLTYIGDNAFSGCSSLEEISIPDKVERIDGKNFYGCSNLKVVRFGKNVTLNEESWFDFNGCYLLERFEVDEENAFFTVINGNLYNKDGSVLLRYCSGKAETVFQIPNTVTRIGDSAFMSANHLETIEIGAGVAQIDDYAFAYCENLNYIKFLGTTSQWNAIQLGNDLGGYKSNPVDEIICSDGNVKIK